MSSHYSFRAEFDRLDEEKIEKTLDWLSNNQGTVNRGKDVNFIFKKGQKKYHLQNASIYNTGKNIFDWGLDEIRIENLEDSRLHIDFSLFIPDNEQNIALLEEVEVDIPPPYPEHFRLKKEFDELLALLRKNKNGNDLVMGNFHLSFRDNHIEIDGASSSLSEFLCRCDDTIKCFKDLCRELDPALAGMTHETCYPAYLAVFVNKNVLMPLCAWDEKQGRIADIEISHIGPRPGACLYWLSRDVVRIITGTMEKHLSLIYEAQRLRTIFKEDSDIRVFVIPHNEMLELKKIFSKISSIYNRRFHDLRIILPAKEYEYISDTGHVGDFIQEALKKKYLIKFLRDEHKIL